MDDIFGPGVASNAYVGSHVEDWYTNQYVKGAYSYTKSGTLSTTRAALASSVQDKLYFAGEATSTNGHGATVHGAMESGARAVEEIYANVSG